MPRPISVDLRMRAIETVLSGENDYDEAAAQFHVGRASISRWLSKYRKTGGVEPLPMGGSQSSFDKEKREVLRWLVFSYPDATLAELVDLLRDEIQFETNDSTLSRVLSELRITRKKKGTAIPAVRTPT